MNDSEDINELCQYLFNTCSNDFVDLFKIIYTVPLESDSSCPFYNNYFMRLVLENESNVRVIVNKHIIDHPINKLPKCLLLNLIRSNGITFTEQEIEINSFLQINNINYRFVGCSIFLGVLPLGHYITYIKFYDKYVSFDENYVFNLFYYHNCPIENQQEMIKAENRLNKRAVLLLYIEDNDPSKVYDLNLIEKIYTDEDKRNFEAVFQNQQILPN